MPIPKTRAELLELLTTSYEKLHAELAAAGADAGSLVCVDDWSVKDLIAVRVWWTSSLLEWIEAGRRGEVFDLPATGYKWNETPRLNNDIIASASDRVYRDLLAELDGDYHKILSVIESLDDKELEDVGVFEWAGKWPVARWISIGAVRQYTTARTFVRKALRAARG